MTEHEKNLPKASEPQIEAIIFDLDGTLYSLRFVKLRMARRLLGSLKLLRNLSGARKALRNERYEGHARLRAALYQKLSELTEVSLSRAETWYENEFYPAFIDTLRTARPRKGLVEFLEQARRIGTRTAVVSDYGQIDNRLQSLGVPPELFDELLSSEDLGCLKPLPDPLALLAQKWQIPPAKICVVGDRLDLDGQFAQNAGAQFLGIADGKTASSKKVGFVSWRAGLRLLENRAGFPPV